MKRHSRLLAMLLMVAAAALVSSGCAATNGGEPPDVGNGGLGSVEKDKQQNAKLAYEDSMERMILALDDEEGPPLDQSISAGDKQALTLAAQRWDAAVNLAAGTKPPKDITKEHANLVKAMKDLSKWNHRIANAAPNKARTKRAAKQAQKSKAAKDYGAAIAALQAKDYQIGPPIQEQEPSL